MDQVIFVALKTTSTTEQNEYNHSPTYNSKLKAQYKLVYCWVSEEDLMGTEVNESLILLVETGSKSSLFSRNIGLGWRELKTLTCVTEIKWINEI